MNPNGVAVKQIQIAEPRGLAAVSLPDPWYPLRDTLDPFQIIATGKLSSLQVRAFVWILIVTWQISFGSAAST